MYPEYDKFSLAQLLDEMEKQLSKAGGALSARWTLGDRGAARHRARWCKGLIIDRYGKAPQ